nr:PREDICTED: uncharacterized protein LOC109044585 [Bemisia tabaci]
MSPTERIGYVVYFYILFEANSCWAIEMKDQSVAKEMSTVIVKLDRSAVMLGDTETQDANPSAYVHLSDKVEESKSQLEKRSLFRTLLGDIPTINNTGVNIGHGNGGLYINGLPSNPDWFISKYSGLFKSFSIGPVHCRWASKSHSQEVVFKGRKVKVNGHVVCQDMSTLKSKEPYYQLAYGALWYTNLPLAKKLTEEEKNHEAMKMAEGSVPGFCGRQNTCGLSVFDAVQSACSHAY